MFLSPEDRLIDTLIVTQKKYGTIMKTRFAIRKDTAKENMCRLYLHIAGNTKRIALDLYVDQRNWDAKKQRLSKIKSEEDKLINLALDAHQSKITNIKIEYQIQGKILTADTLEAEFLNKLSRTNFVGFWFDAMKGEKSNLGKDTYRRHMSVYNNFAKFRNHVSFSELSVSFFNKYRSHRISLGNNSTTVNSNFAVIKKYLGLAIKSGIKLDFDLEDIKVGSTKGNRSYLTVTEIEKCLLFYENNMFNESHRLIIGYFLFSCFTGLRISNVLELSRERLSEDEFFYTSVKSNKDRIMKLNETAQKIIHGNNQLFVKKFHPNVINRDLKKVMITLGIKKKVTFHYARHTFATLYLKAGGKVHNLQQHLAHKKIETTMIYVHIVALEANEEMVLLDKLFQRN